MGWLPSIFTLVFVILGILWYVYYGKNRVVRDGAVYHIFARLGQRRFEGLDIELRSILKEKGLRDQDPFDAVVANSKFIELDTTISFAEIVKIASEHLAEIVGSDAEFLEKSFMDGTQVGATPVSHGAALPHIRVQGIEHSEMIMVRTAEGVHVEIDDSFISEQDVGKPIHAFFFLASPEENPGQHLRILAQIASHVDDEKFIGQWLDARNEQDLKELLLREDRYISLVLTRGTPTEELIGLEVRDISLPEGSLITIIHREGQIIVPRGRTLLKEHDRLTVISYPKGIEELRNRYHDI
jgi:mannitol/fructose-specific phosphotransferase system IIA component (Ntr-type)